MKKIINFIFLLGISSVILGQNREIFVGNYLVTKIHVANDCYLIFLKKEDNTRYTIFSKKESIERPVKGRKIQKDSTYYFELIYEPPKINPVSSLAITNSYGFTQFETGYLCTTKNLIGLTIISTDNGSKVKKAKRKNKK